MNLFALIYACDYIFGFDNFDEEIAVFPWSFSLYFILLTQVFWGIFHWSYYFWLGVMK